MPEDRVALARYGTRYLNQQTLDIFDPAHVLTGVVDGSSNASSWVEPNSSPMRCDMPMTRGDTFSYRDLASPSASIFFFAFHVGSAHDLCRHVTTFCGC